METIKLIYWHWDVSAVDIIVLFEQYCVNDSKMGSGYGRKMNSAGDQSYF